MKQNKKRIMGIFILSLAMPLLIGATPWDFVKLKDDNPMIDINGMIEQKIFPWDDGSDDSNNVPDDSDVEPTIPPENPDNTSIRIRVMGQKITVNGKLCKDKDTLRETILGLYGRKSTVDIIDYYAEYHAYETVLQTLEEMKITSGITQKTAYSLEEVG